MSRRPWHVILLPGSIMPAGPAYDALIEALDGDAVVRAKELEVYAGDSPPPGYSMEHEIDGILRVASDAGWERFHLGGYSGGGAAALAFTAAHPKRVLSLALMEPAFAGWQQMTEPERAHFERFREVMHLPDAEQMRRFRELQMAEGVPVTPPPAGPPPAWMAKRPAGVRAFLDAFFASDLDLEALRHFDRPVWFALGGLSHPDYWARMAVRLMQVLPDLSIETFPERHHFDPPHRVEPARVAESLRRLWARADPDARDEAAEAAGAEADAASGPRPRREARSRT